MKLNASIFPSVHLPSCLRHFIKLVNAANAVVRQHQRSGLEHELLGLRVFGDVGGETHRRRPFAAGVLRPGQEAVHVLQQLGLGGTGVSAQQNVNIRSVGC